MAILLALTALVWIASAGSAPPPDLVKLEREVSLMVAHARIEGPAEARSRERLGEAERLDLAGEKALQGGDYKAAEDNFLRAKLLMRQAGE